MSEVEILKASYDEKFKTLFNKIDKIEKQTDNIQQLTIAINNIANNLENIAEQTRKNSKEIDDILQIDAKKYRELVKYVLLTIIGAIIGYILTTIGVK